MLIAARNSFMAGGKLSAKSYVQSGLVAMWDGIENAGLGVHDGTDPLWHNLIPNSIFPDVNTTGIAHVSYDESSKSWEWGAAPGGNNNFSVSDNRFLTFVQSLDAITLECRIKRRSIGAYDTASPLVCGIVIDGHFAYDTWNIYVASPLLEKNRMYPTPFISTFTNISLISPINDTDIPFSVLRDAEELSTYINWTQQSQWHNKFAVGGTYENAGIWIQSVRIYSRALTADEIAHNYAVDKARFGLL